MKGNTSDVSLHGQDLIKGYHTRRDFHRNRAILGREVDKLNHQIWTHFRDERINFFEHNKPAAGYMYYNMNATYDYTDRFVDMCDCFTGHCTVKDMDTVIAHHKLYSDWKCVYSRYLVFLLTALLSLFGLAWLVFGKMSLDYCLFNDVDVSRLNLTEGLSNTPVHTCQRLASQCHSAYMGGFEMSLDNYYSFRLVVYAFSIVPLVFIACGANTFMHKLDDNLLNARDDEAFAKAVAPKVDTKDWNSMSPCANACGGLYDVHNFSSREFFLFAAFLVSITHVVLGILSLAADGTIIQYFNALGGACAHGRHLDLSLDADQRCACATVFQSGSDALLMRLSSVQLNNAQMVAYALLFPNIAYVLWGFAFIIRSCIHANDELHLMESFYDDPEAGTPRHDTPRTPIHVNGMQSTVQPELGVNHEDKEHNIKKVRHLASAISRQHDNTDNPTDDDDEDIDNERLHPKVAFQRIVAKGMKKTRYNKQTKQRGDESLQRMERASVLRHGQNSISNGMSKKYEHDYI